MQANPNVTASDALRPYQGFASIFETSDRGTSNYQGMQVNLKRRLSNNFLFGAAYTFSKLLDNGSSRGSVLPNYYNQSTNLGPADFDLRHVLVVDYVWNVAYGTTSATSSPVACSATGRSPGSPRPRPAHPSPSAQATNTPVWG